MKLAVMTDEVSSDFGSALEILSTWDVDAVEIRRVGERRYPDVSEYWLDRVPRLLQEFRLPVVAISPGLFKIRYPGEPAPPPFHRDADEVQVDRETAIAAALSATSRSLPRSIQAAEQLRAPIIIVWSFERQDNGLAPEATVQVLATRQARPQARHHSRTRSPGPQQPRRRPGTAGGPSSVWRELDACQRLRRWRGRALSRRRQPPEAPHPPRPLQGRACPSARPESSA